MWELNGKAKAMWLHCTGQARPGHCTRMHQISFNKVQTTTPPIALAIRATTTNTHIHTYIYTIMQVEKMERGIWSIWINSWSDEESGKCMVRTAHHTVEEKEILSSPPHPPIISPGQFSFFLSFLLLFLSFNSLLFNLHVSCFYYPSLLWINHIIPTLHVFLSYLLWSPQALLSFGCRLQTNEPNGHHRLSNHDPRSGEVTCRV